MSDALLLNLSALIALLPASLVAQRKIAARDTVFWLVLGVAIAGPALLLVVTSTAVSYTHLTLPTIYSV